MAKHYTPESIESLTKLLVKLARGCGEQLEPKEQELLRSYSDFAMGGGRKRWVEVMNLIRW